MSELHDACHHARNHVVIDWLVICTLKPRAIMPPGTEDCAGWGDYIHHVRDQFGVRGISVLLIASALIGACAWWLT